MLKNKNKLILFFIGVVIVSILLYIGFYDELHHIFVDTTDLNTLN